MKGVFYANGREYTNDVKHSQKVYCDTGDETADEWEHTLCESKSQAK